MNKSDAGKLGYIASTEKQAQNKLKRIEIYNSSPKFCCYCQEKISYEKRRNKFCNSSCSAKFTNPLSKLKKRGIFICKECNVEIQRTRENKNNKYCSFICSANHKKKLTFEKLLSLGYDTNPTCSNAKRYLIHLFGNVCTICKGTEWFGNPMPLVIDHINGNPNDNSLDNLRIICPNCDKYTPFFGSKNRGNGRWSRRKRYQEGKSS